MGTLTYHQLVAASSLRTNSLAGVDAVNLEITYSTLPLTSADFVSSIFPFSDYIAAAAWVEGKIAEVVSEVGNHPLRAYILGQTAPLTSGATMPSLDENDTPIIGIYGSVLDGTDTNIVCTEGTIEQIRRYNQAPTIFLLSPYQYKMDGNGIVHTQTSVVIQVCVFDGAARLAAATNNEAILFPDSLAEAYIAGMVSYAMRDDEFMNQAQAYRQYFNETLMGIRGGLTSVSSVAIPGPSIQLAGAP